MKTLKQPVFLVVDNFSRSCWEEAKWYAKDVKLPEGSYVLVTSRSQQALESLLGSGCCHPFPELEPDEAKQLFLSNAFPSTEHLPTLQLTSAESQILEECLRRCCIDNQYIPRLLTKLAFFLHEKTKGDILSWKKYIAGADSILALEYNKLDDISKLIFLDLATFAIDLRFTHMDFHGNMKWDEHTNFKLVVDFLAMLHGIPFHEAERKVGVFS